MPENQGTPPTAGPMGSCDADKQVVPGDEYGVPQIVLTRALRTAYVGLALCLFVALFLPDWYRLKAILLGLWTIGIPVFYLFEWSLTKFRSTDTAQYKFYVEGRELSQKLWLAIASFLTLIFFGEYLKGVSKAELDPMEMQIKKLNDKTGELQTKNERLQKSIDELKRRVEGSK